MGIGEIAALGAALMWTISAILWGRIRLSAIGINLSKNCLGSLILISHLILLATAFNQPVLSAPIRSWGWLGLSGLVGIGLGDTCFFRSLQILGPRRSLIIASTGPLFATWLGWVTLGETLTYVAFSGIVMTIVGVVIVVADRKAVSEAPGIMPGTLSVGVVLGLLGAVCQVVGGICSKHAMTRKSTGSSSPTVARWKRRLLGCLYRRWQPCLSFSSWANLEIFAATCFAGKRSNCLSRPRRLEPGWGSGSVRLHSRKLPTWRLPRPYIQRARCLPFRSSGSYTDRKALGTQF